MISYEGNEPYIFISYSHRNSEIVLPIAEALQKAGFRLWYDGGIELGTDWSEYIEDHILNCGALLFFLSKDTVESRNCREEFNLAYSENKEILIVYVEDLAPSDLRHGLRMRVPSYQCLYRHRYPNDAALCEVICRARVLAHCREAIPPAIPAPAEPVAPTAPTPAEDTDAALDYDSVDALLAEVDETIDDILSDPDGTGTDSTVAEDTDTEDAVTATVGEASEGLSFTLNEGGDGYVVSGIGSFDGTELVIPAEHEGLPVVALAESAFEGCKQLTSVVLPDTVTTLGKCVFLSCAALSHIRLSANLTAIPSQAFEECGALTEITIPNSVTSIGSWAFEDCVSLTSLQLPEGVTEIGKDTFLACSALASLSLPETLESIGNSAFDRCTALTSLTLPKSLSKLGGSAFKGCDGLKAIDFSGTRAQWNELTSRFLMWSINSRVRVIHCTDGDCCV